MRTEAVARETILIIELVQGLFSDTFLDVSGRPAIPRRVI